jgi:hypothetical protein
MTGPRTRLGRIGASLAIVIVLAVMPAGTPIAADPDASLLDLNTAFRAHYADARRAVLSRERVIMVIAFDRAILFRNSQRVEEPFTPPIYERVKTIAHIPLALYALSVRWGDDPLPPDAINALTAYRGKVRAARVDLEALKLSPAVLARQYAIIDAVISEIDRTLQKRRYDGRSVRALCQSLTPTILDNVREAARAQLDGLHAVVQRWRGMMGESDWDRAKIVVLGVRQARVDNLQFAYFQRVLGASAVNQRLFYAEGLFTEQLGLDLLGTILLDRGVSTAFFGDESRMERDILGDAAAAYLDEWFGKPR